MGQWHTFPSPGALPPSLSVSIPSVSLVPSAPEVVGAAGSYFLLDIPLVPFASAVVSSLAFG